MSDARDADAGAPTYQHLVADFLGVAPPKLRDGALLSGLLIAAASAAGVPAMGAPLVRHLPDDGLSAFLIVDGCHMSVHTVPARGLLLLDVLALVTHDAQRAQDVFARRLAAREIRSDVRARG